MSTIASPRASIALSSRRTSTSTDTVTAANGAGGDRNTTTLRRNRAALRDYYNLPASSSSPVPPEPHDGETEESNPFSRSEETDPESPNEFDLPTFHPPTYATDLLRTQNLHSVWRSEAQLLRAIRHLDGEKKALVYDNYAKLIAATETIRKMRARMDPLTPATSTLTPAVGHIASLAEELSSSFFASSSTVRVGGGGEKRDTVKWVLGAPGRLRGLMDDGRREEAVEQWRVVEELLTAWEGTRGVEDVRTACEEVMRGEESEGD